jgi:hypothetical protein
MPQRRPERVFLLEGRQDFRGRWQALALSA